MPTGHANATELCKLPVPSVLTNSQYWLHGDIHLLHLLIAPVAVARVRSRGRIVVASTLKDRLMIELRNFVSAAKDHFILEERNGHI
jgi:hypothetical protein